jgi:CRP/FNR family transcriptional regulator, cyclic AMP receptor protein
MTSWAADDKYIEFDCKTFLSSPGNGKKIAAFTRKEMIFVQGDLADAVFHIRRGMVGLNVVSETGKEAMIGILNEGDFFGESCLARQPLRQCSATAMTDCSVMRIEKNVVAEALHNEPEFAVMFVDYLLSRNLRYEADLVDQLFNSSEKRLARILLLLARLDKESGIAAVIPMVSHETLASMVGTTRSRVGFFLKKFRTLGFVTYDERNRLQINSSLVHLVLNG